MKKSSVLLFFILLQSIVYSQAHLNSSAAMFSLELSVVKSFSESDIEFQRLVEMYDLVRIDGQFTVGVLALTDTNKLNITALKSKGIVNDTRLENLWTFRVPVNQFQEFINIPGIQYVEVGESISPLLERGLISSRVDSVHMGLGGLTQSYTGKGVIVAIIDWGFDYTHPVFYDTSMTHYRVSRAWDQNKLSGPAPQGYSFGTEYIGQAQLLEAACDTVYVFGHSSHGTHVGGIAGGAGAGTVHKGVAFESELLFISLRRDAPSLIDAFSYVANYAASVNKPFVINMSFGSHLGPHDGTSLKNLGIDILHGPGKVFVGSAGNNGGLTSRFHLDYDFSTNPGDTLKTVVGFTSYQDQFGQTLSMWGSEFSDFSVSVCMVDQNDSIVYQTAFFNILYEPFLVDTVVLFNDSLIVRVQSTKQHFLNNKPNIRLEIGNKSPHKIVLKVVSNNTHLHIWNNVRMNNRYTNWGVNLNSNYPGATHGDHNYGLGEPAGVGKNVITVASYRAEGVHPTTGNPIYGQMSDFSSRGPTVDNRTKPDIASSGHFVISSVNSFDPGYTSFNETVQFDDKTYGFATMSGTSMSGPMVTGIVALMLEAFPTMSATQAKEILKITARLDSHTGNIDYTDGHLQWGWGKANALAAVKMAETMSNVPEIIIIEQMFSLFPNPANNIVNLNINCTFNNTVLVEVFSMNGQTMLSLQNECSNIIPIDISGLQNGIYLVSVKTDNKISMQKLIISN